LLSEANSASRDTTMTSSRPSSDATTIERKLR
jgi:hypothetical protein